MPYIKEGQRKELLEEGRIPNNPGELNYMFTMMILHYFTANGGNYQAANDIMGALEGAKMEFYRRVVSPYEDRKIEENGDVIG